MDTDESTTTFYFRSYVANAMDHVLSLISSISFLCILFFRVSTTMTLVVMQECEFKNISCTVRCVLCESTDVNVNPESLFFTLFRYIQSSVYINTVGKQTHIHIHPYR